jgi:hypothetical protein
LPPWLSLKKKQSLPNCLHASGQLAALFAKDKGEAGRRVGVEERPLDDERGART